MNIPYFMSRYFLGAWGFFWMRETPHSRQIAGGVPARTEPGQSSALDQD
jgi:hypothetical protein